MHRKDENEIFLCFRPQMFWLNITIRRMFGVKKRKTKGAQWWCENSIIFLIVIVNCRSDSIKWHTECQTIYCDWMQCNEPERWKKIERADNNNNNKNADAKNTLAAVKYSRIQFSLTSGVLLMSHFQRFSFIVRPLHLSASFFIRLMRLSIS